MSTIRVNQRTLTIEDYVRIAQEQRAEAMRNAFRKIGLQVKSLFTEPEAAKRPDLRHAA